MDHTLVNLLLVLFIAWVSGSLARRLGFPAILGELASGVIFGPSLLGILQETAGLSVLGEVGVFLMMLYVGMEVDYRSLAKVSRAGFLAALGGFVVPYMAGYYFTLSHGGTSMGALFMGLAMGVTALIAKSRILIDLNLLGTRIANVLFAGAVISDTFALIVFSMVQGAVNDKGLFSIEVLYTIGKATLFFGATIFIGVRVFPRIGKMLRRFGFAERTTNFTLILLIGLIFAALAEMAGLHAILGAFLAGLFISEEVFNRKISREVSTLVHDLSIGFLAPVFFVTVGFHVDLSVLWNDFGFLALIILIASLSKVIGTALFYLPSGNGLREGLTIGIGMNGRGAVEIIIAQMALAAGLIDVRIFSVLVFMAFFTTGTVPFLLKWATDILQKRGELVRQDVERSGYIFLGAFALSRKWASVLASKDSVTFIDTNEQRCAATEKEGFRVIRGNALREDVLDLAGSHTASVFLAVTSNPDVNFVAAKSAAENFGVPHIFLNSGKDRFAEGAQGSQPLKNIFHDENMDWETWNRWVLGNETNIISIKNEKSQSLLDLAKHINGAYQGFPLAIKRNQQTFLPSALQNAEVGDEIVVLAHVDNDLPASSDKFQEMVSKALMLDVVDVAEDTQFFDRVSDLFANRLDYPAEKIKKLFLKREKESSTVIVPGFAVPHIMIEGKSKSDLIISRSKTGIKFFESPDLVNIIFCLVGTKDERNDYLKLISGIAQMFQDPTFEKRWMAAQGEEDLRRVILETDRRRF